MIRGLWSFELGRFTIAAADLVPPASLTSRPQGILMRWRNAPAFWHVRDRSSRHIGAERGTGDEAGVRANQANPRLTRRGGRIAHESGRSKYNVTAYSQERKTFAFQLG